MQIFYCQQLYSTLLVLQNGEEAYAIMGKTAYVELVTFMHWREIILHNFDGFPYSFSEKYLYLAANAPPPLTAEENVAK